MTPGEIIILKEIFPLAQSIAIAWIIWRIKELENKMGNGKQGVFPRKAEIDIQLSGLAKSIEKTEARLDKVEEKINA